MSISLVRARKALQNPFCALKQNLYAAHEHDREVAKSKNIFPEKEAIGNAIEVALSKNPRTPEADLHIPDISQCHKAKKPKSGQYGITQSLVTTLVRDFAREEEQYWRCCELEEN